MTERHTMHLVNHDTRTRRWACETCTRILLFEAGRMTVVDPGDQTAIHFGQAGPITIKPGP